MVIDGRVYLLDPRVYLFDPSGTHQGMQDLLPHSLEDIVDTELNNTYWYLPSLAQPDVFGTPASVERYIPVGRTGPMDLSSQHCDRVRQRSVRVW